MGPACQLGSPCGGIHGKQKRDHTKHRASKMRSNSCVMSSQKPDGDERWVMRVRGSRLHEERTDNKRGLKGRTVNILLLFLEILPDNSSSYLCRSKFCIFLCPSPFYYNLLQVLAKLLQAAQKKQKKPKMTECVRLPVVLLKDFNVYIQVRNPSFAAHFSSCVYTHACKQTAPIHSSKISGIIITPDIPGWNRNM